VLCSKCAADLPEGSQFCLNCGQPVGTLLPDIAEPAENAILGCSRCGANLPEGAEFCPNCGTPVLLPAKGSKAKDLPGSVDASTSVPGKKGSRRVVLLALLSVLLIAIVWVAVSDNPYAQGIQELVGWKHDQTILETPFSVAAHSFRYYKFALPEGSVNVAIVGQFAASGEGGKVASAKAKDKNADNNIEVYVLSEPAFTVWQNGFATSVVYESGRVSEGRVQADLPAGAGIYYLVFSNKFAPKAAKNVQASVLLRYKSWLPDWFRRTIDRLFNWFGP
jgi:ribosomal protein L40E